MAENCEDCMRWEEELYWTHFQTLHFAQLLLAGFQNRLAIPQKFSTHCKRKLPETVTLRSPSGAAYTVKVEEDDEKTLSFCLGWDKFVKDHSLKENDLLIFKFHGVSEFEVLILDGYTLCEKPASYFVRKCECGHAKKRKGTDFSETSTGSPKIHVQPSLPTYGNEVDDLLDIDTLLNPNLVVSETGYEQDAHINSEIDTTTSDQLPVIPPTNTGQNISEGVCPLNVFKKMRRETSNNDLDTKADVEMISAGSSIDETCRRKALEQAEKSISPNGFLVVMKRSHVVSKCFLTIPSRWYMKSMSLGPQEVVMKVDQSKWHMKYNIFGSRGRGGISTGWKKFVKDNNLCMGDVCVFEPDNSEAKPLHLDVYIFRAEVATMVDSEVYTISE